MPKQVPVRVWTCEVHERPEWHECDCEFCAWEEPDCCKAARWVDKLDDGGNVVMRDVEAFEEILMRGAVDSLTRSSAVIAWLEDERIPKVRS